MMNHRGWVSGLLLCWLMSGCSSVPTSTPEKAVFIDSDSTTQAPSERNANVQEYRQTGEALPAVARRWLDQALQASESGQYTDAEKQTQKALRVAPRSPEPYLVMAEIKWAQGLREQAKQFALKAKSLAGSYSQWQVRLNRILQ